MRVLLGGASGFVGSHLIPHLKAQGYEVSILTRSVALSLKESSSIYWNPDTGEIDRARLEGFDLVILLNGANITGGLWTKKRKRLLLSSRVQSTRLLAKALSSLKQKPSLFLVASAVGFYGDRKEEVDEMGPVGSSFLSRLCKEWELASQAAHEAGVVVYHLRFGVVLSKEGGALLSLIRMLKWGLGAILGRGDQAISWIMLEDLIRGIDHLIKHQIPSMQAINFCTPYPTTQKEMIETLGKVLNRRIYLKIPAFILSLLPGGMGREILLAHSRVYPLFLLQSGFQFAYPKLEDAFNQIFVRREQ